MQSNETAPTGTIDELRIPEAQPTSPLAAALEEALAQHARADRGEAGVYNAPHLVACGKRSRDICPCACWKSEATA